MTNETTSAAAFLDAAAKHMRDRAATYDKPGGERSMAKTVAAFNAITGHTLSTADGWLLLQVLKQVRAFTNPAAPHRDSLEDSIAYGALLAEEMLGGGEPVQQKLEFAEHAEKSCDTCKHSNSVFCVKTGGPVGVNCLNNGFKGWEPQS